MKALPFIGRQKQLKQLNLLLNKKTASLVVVKGRRRVGKSRLVQEFAKNHRFYEFAGLYPQAGITDQTQRDVFANQLETYFHLPRLSSNDWTNLFNVLIQQTSQGRVIILFDEITWMAHEDPTFLGKLKNAWDMGFKKNHELILILCGSISVWIEENLLSSTGYFGRIPTTITLDELSLHECNDMLNELQFVGSSYEKFQLLSITGGIPYYLEQIQPGFDAQTNIHQLCFMEEALLVKEFDLIFKDIFDSKSEIYKKIVWALGQGNLEQNEIIDAIQYSKSGKLSQYLDDLISARFISRDFTWKFKDGKTSRLSHYRLTDNYLRFYVKYIFDALERINQGIYDSINLMDLPGWSTVMGYQFENLVLKNRKTLIHLLEINPNLIVANNPYFQRKSESRKGCQIDYLIQTRFNSLIVCEIKFSKNVLGKEIIDEVKEKIGRLSIPRGYSCFPVLIHVNGVTDSVMDAGYFMKIIDFKELLTCE